MFNFFTSVILCIALFNLNWTLKKYTNPDNINTWLGLHVQHNLPIFERLEARTR